MPRNLLNETLHSHVLKRPRTVERGLILNTGALSLQPMRLLKKDAYSGSQTFSEMHALFTFLNDMSKDVVERHVRKTERKETWGVAMFFLGTWGFSRNPCKSYYSSQGRREESQNS